MVDTDRSVETQPWIYTSEGYAYDAPGNTLSLRNSEFARSDSFVMTLMVKPTSYTDSDGFNHAINGGIYVPVAKIPWNWKYNALASNPGAYYLDGSEDANFPSVIPTVMYPTWRGSGTALECALPLIQSLL